MGVTYRTSTLMKGLVLVSANQYFVFKIWSKTLRVANAGANRRLVISLKNGVIADVLVLIDFQIIINLNFLWYKERSSYFCSVFFKYWSIIRKAKTSMLLLYILKVIRLYRSILSRKKGVSVKISMNYIFLKNSYKSYYINAWLV